MVCPMCLVPLFLVPLINLLPRIIDFLLAKVYAWLGWEYRKPARVPPACPFKPNDNKNSTKAAAEAGAGSTQGTLLAKPVVAEEIGGGVKQD